MNEQQETRIRPADILKSPRALILLIAGIASAALVLLVAGSPAHYIYDEPYYIQGAWLLRKGASFREMLLAPLHTPAGPLYPAMHWLLAPLTGLHAPAFRWPNLALLAAGSAALVYTMRCRRLADPWARTAMLLAVPIFWPSTGIALTEMPAFAFVCFAVAATAWAMTAAPESSARSWGGFTLAGLCFGIAILGRQPYLPAAGGFVLIALFEPRFRWPAALAAILACAVPLPVFLLWHGLVAPQVANVGGISLQHGALAFAYISVIVMILAPRYFVTRWQWSLGIGLLVGLAGLLFGGMPATVAPGVAGHLPAVLARLFQAGVSVILVGGGAAFIISSAINMLDRREDRFFVLMVVLTLGMTCTAASIVHIFSSRYVMAAFPFALLAVQPYFIPSRCAALRFAFGAAAGYLSLAHYFSYAVPTG